MLTMNHKNPFLNFKVDDAATIPPGDVPELHERVLEGCRAALDSARQAGQSTSLLVVGEAGSGKSHLIAQFRKKVAVDPKAVLAAIRLGGASAGCLWRHLRERFVVELFQRYATTENGENGLLRILQNSFPTWASDDGSGGGVLRILLGKRDPVEVCGGFFANLPKAIRVLATICRKYCR